MRMRQHGLPKNITTQLGKIISPETRYVVNPRDYLSNLLRFQNIDIPKYFNQLLRLAQTLR